MPNPFVHIELNTQDVTKSKEFYGSLFSWKLEDVPMGDIGIYTTIGVGEGTAGGIMKHPMPGAPSMWLPYVNVDDIHASTAKAKALGATIIVDVKTVAEMGWLSIFIDPTGATLGLWQQKKA
jgi:predicted enzyme related to lactoylglutathione lyase